MNQAIVHSSELIVRIESILLIWRAIGAMLLSDTPA